MYTDTCSNSLLSEIDKNMGRPQHLVAGFYSIIVVIRSIS